MIFNGLEPIAMKSVASKCNSSGLHLKAGIKPSLQALFNGKAVTWNCPTAKIQFKLSAVWRKHARLKDSRAVLYLLCPSSTHPFRQWLCLWTSQETKICLDHNILWNKYSNISKTVKSGNCCWGYLVQHEAWGIGHPKKGLLMCLTKLTVCN